MQVNIHATGGLGGRDTPSDTLSSFKGAARSLPRSGAMWVPCPPPRALAVPCPPCAFCSSRGR